MRFGCDRNVAPIALKCRHAGQILSTRHNAHELHETGAARASHKPISDGWGGNKSLHRRKRFWKPRRVSGLALYRRGSGRYWN